MLLNVFYYTGRNFGDRLNKDILKKEAGLTAVCSRYETAAVIGIGSILSHIVLKDTAPEKQSIESGVHPSKSRTRNRAPIFCFSTGFHEENDIKKMTKGAPAALARPVRFYAVRGKKSMELLWKEKLYSGEGGGGGVVIGDGGLLCCDLLSASPKKLYEVGIVPHAYERKNKIFQQIKQRIPNSRILDIRKKPKAFLKDLSQCETVVSTALHPLIACDSLRIPNLWIRLDEELAATSRFKFWDYYSAFDYEREPVRADKLDAGIKDFILETYAVSDQMVLQKQNELRDALGKLKEDLKNLSFRRRRAVCGNIAEKIFFVYPKRYIIIYPYRMIRKIYRKLLSIGKGRQRKRIRFTHFKQNKQK